MPAVPKRKYSKARQGERRSHLHLELPNLSPCPNCGAPNLPHQVCKVCGHYRGIEVIPMKKRASNR
jgi:large subunit ribosomal protein L32